MIFVAHLGAAANADIAAFIAVRGEEAADGWSFCTDGPDRGGVGMTLATLREREHG